MRIRAPAENFVFGQNRIMRILYIATNPDWVCPTRHGYAPDCGSVSEMLARATGKKLKFIGKPEPAMAELAMKMTGFDKFGKR